MIPEYKDIAEFIHMNYKNKVVEIGVGNLPEVALSLKDELEVIVTDIMEHKYAGIRFCMDDIFTPDPTIYENASLIYSIRPPVDLQDAIAAIAKNVGADLLIRPFGTEKADLRRYFKQYDLINYKKARFYLYRK